MITNDEQREAERRRTCRWKNTFSTRAKAKQAAILYASKGWRKTRHASKLRPYRCSTCGMWHLTTSEARDGKKERD